MNVSTNDKMDDDLSGWTVPVKLGSSIMTPSKEHHHHQPPSSRDNKDNSSVVLYRFALFIDGMTRAALVPFGPRLVHRLLFASESDLTTTAAEALSSNWSQVAIPYAIVVAMYSVGRSLGSMLAQRFPTDQKRLQHTMARLGGAALALHVFSFGAGLDSLFWLVMIRFSSAVASGWICQITEVIHNNSNLSNNEVDAAAETEQDRMESGALNDDSEGKQQSIARKNVEMDANVETGKIYITGVALSILTGGLLYKYTVNSALFRALTGAYHLTLSPLFLIGLSLLLEAMLRPIFAFFTEETEYSGRKRKIAEKVGKVGGAVRRLVGRVVSRRRRRTVDVDVDNAEFMTPERAMLLQEEEAFEFYDPLTLSRHALTDNASVRSRFESHDEFFDCSSLTSEDLEGGFGMDSLHGGQQQLCDRGVARYVNRKCVFADGTPSFVPQGDNPAIIPNNFVDFCGGNHAKAQKMWEATQKWRFDNQVWKIHSMPNQWFTKIKEAYPHFIHGHSKAGYPIVYEQPGRMNLKELFRNGCEIADMVRHYMFFMEFVANCICTREDVRAAMGPHPPPHSSSSWGIMVVMDVKGAGLSHLSGDVVKYLKQAGDINSSYYPMTMKRAFLVNSPFWLAGAWSGIKVILPESVQVDILSENNYPAALREFIDEDQIPPEYGGKSPYHLGYHPFEVQLRELVELAAQEENVSVVDITPPPQSIENTHLDCSVAYQPLRVEAPPLLPRKRGMKTFSIDGHPIRRRTVSADRVRWQEPLTHGRGESYGGYKRANVPEFEILVVASLVHVIWSALQGTLELVVPLWILSPPILGGLGYMPSRSGVALFCSAVVLLWVMRTMTLPRLMSQIPVKSPLRAFRIGVGTETVLLLLLALVPSCAL